MAITHFPNDGVQDNLATARPARRGRTFLRGMARTGLRMVVNTAVYLSAVVLGLSVGPLLFLLADRSTALNWANSVLDFVSH